MVTARPISATDVAATVGLAHASASYHLRQLARVDLVEPVTGVESRPGRSGRPKQLYRMRKDAFQGLDRRAARLLDRALLSDLDARLGQPGTKRTVSDAEVWLKPRDWRNVIKLVRQAGVIVHERGQAPRSRGARHVSATTLLLEFRK